MGAPATIFLRGLHRQGRLDCERGAALERGLGRRARGGTRPPTAPSARCELRATTKATSFARPSREQHVSLEFQRKRPLSGVDGPPARTDEEQDALASVAIPVTRSSKPSKTLSLLVSLAMLASWGIVRLVVFPHFMLPLSYVAPLFVCVWTRDRTALLGLTAVFMVLLTLELFWVLPPAALSGGARWSVYGALLAIIAGTATLVRLVIDWRESLEDASQRACATAEQVRSKAVELHASETRVRQLAEAMPNLVWTCTPDGLCDYVGPQWVGYTGLPETAILGFRVLELVHPEDRDALTLAWSNAVRDGGVFDVEFRIRRHDGMFRWFKARGVDQRDGSGRVVKWFGSNTDIHDLRMAEQRLRVADRSKADFLATLSHELRNPLAAIRYALNVAMTHENAGARALSVIDRQLQHLVRLVDDLLDITRIGSNRFQLRVERVELATVIQQAVDTALPEVRRAEHALVVGLTPTPLELDADPVRMAQVIHNLLSNAARYTPQGGHIELSARAAEGMVVISVGDDGIGVLREDLDRIFEMFTQLGEPGRVGLGVGLALVKAIVEGHGGYVTVHSEGRGRGSRFDVHLPQWRAA
jgi:PAS domain S-box-containing protein